MFDAVQLTQVNLDAAINLRLKVQAFQQQRVVLSHGHVEVEIVWTEEAAGLRDRLDELVKMLFGDLLANLVREIKR